MSRRGAVAVVALLWATGALVAGAGVASAHQVDPSVLTVIDSVTPAVAGVHVEVATSVTTELLATNDTDQVLEVLADTGEAFLRIGPTGVQANLASPSWYLTNDPFGSATIPAGVAASAPPRWAQVSSERSWGWFDHRLHPVAMTTGLAPGQRPAFRVPMRLGGAPFEVRGHLEPRTTVQVFTAVLRSLPTPASGLLVQLIDGRAPGLFVRYQGSGSATVAGADGEPFLRLSPAGAEVNRRSPTWLFSAQARGEDLTGVEVDPAAPPVWAVVSSSPSYAWVDPRALIKEVGNHAVTLDWVVPVVVDGHALAVTGRSSASVTPVAAVLAAGATSPAGTSGRRIGLVVGATSVTLLAFGALAWPRWRARAGGSGS